MMAAAYLPYIMRDPSTQTYRRGVAQPGSAPPWGGGGRRFKSSRPDQHQMLTVIASLPPRVVSDKVILLTRMARPSIASLCPPARRGAGGKPVRRTRGRDADAPLRDLQGKGAKRREMLRHPGRAFFLFLFFSRAKKKK